VTLLFINQLAGHEEYVALRDQYMRYANVFILTCSCTSKRSVEELQCFYERILLVKDQDKFPMVIAMNKADLKNTVDEQVSMEHLYQQLPWIKQQNIQVFETSAKEGTMVEEAYHAACRLFREEEIKRHKQLSKNKYQKSNQCSMQ